jgi:AhpD family alkylhydroperoxidase
MNATHDVLLPRIDIRRHMGSASARALLALQQDVETSGLDHSLIELVKIRASQINGCAYCIDMHTTDARALGETEQRIYGLSAWRETPFYTPRERAALAWTEAVTLLSATHVPDEAHDEARAHFDEADLVKLTWAVVAINAWNRLAVSFRSVPGTYRRARA